MDSIEIGGCSGGGRRDASHSTPPPSDRGRGDGSARPTRCTAPAPMSRSGTVRAAKLEAKVHGNGTTERRRRSAARKGATGADRDGGSGTARSSGRGIGEAYRPPHHRRVGLRRRPRSPAGDDTRMEGKISPGKTKTAEIRGFQLGNWWSQGPPNQCSSSGSGIHRSGCFLRILSVECLSSFATIRYNPRIDDGLDDGLRRCRRWSRSSTIGR